MFPSFSHLWNTSARCGTKYIEKLKKVQQFALHLCFNKMCHCIIYLLINKILVISALMKATYIQETLLVPDCYIGFHTLNIRIGNASHTLLKQPEQSRRFRAAYIPAFLRTEQ